MIENINLCEESYEEDITKKNHIKNANEKYEKYTSEKELKILLNCNLKVDFDTKNKTIYLSPGKSQYFTVEVANCIGDVTIKYNGKHENNKIYGNLGVYRIVQSGIIVDAYSKPNTKDSDIFNFVALDESTDESYEFVVVFSSYLYCNKW